MKTKLYFICILCMACILGSCETEQEDIATPLKIGSGSTTLDSISINVLSERDILIKGGNGKYRANIEDSRIATAKVIGDTLRVKGLVTGRTFVHVSSHNQQQRLDIQVESPLPQFSKDVIRIYPDKSEVRRFTSLTGGDVFTTLKIDDPDDILEVKWDGKTDLLEIKAFYEGDAYIIATTPEGIETKMKVEVRVKDEPQKVGIYHTSGRYVNNNVALNGVLVAQREGIGVWISNTANPYVGNVIYTGSCMQIDPIVNPKVGSYIDISVKAFKGARVIPEGKHRVLVEKIRDNLVQLRSNRYKFLIPYEEKN